MVPLYSTTHTLSHDTTLMAMLLMVHELWCFIYGASFAYYGRLFHVFLKTVSQSDTESGVQFHLALAVQKMADRRIVHLSLCAAFPMVEGLMDSPHVLILIIGDVMAQCFLIYRHYVHVLKCRVHI